MNEYRKNRCLEIARSLQHLRSGKSLHFAFILRRNQLLTYAANDYNKQHLAHKFGEYKPIKVSNSNNYIAGRHAEISALSIYLNKFGDLDMRGLTLFVCRIGYDGQPMNSKPCGNCEKVLSATNFKEIIWT